MIRLHQVEPLVHNFMSNQYIQGMPAYGLKRLTAKDVASCKQGKCLS